MEGVTMFEKEAEEAGNQKIKENNQFARCARKSYKDGFKDGAEFGYNKANEWHYPSKGEYPKECENVLCYCKVVDVKFCSIGHTIIGGDDKIKWWSSNRSEELNVYAWKEITPPKEIKEND